MNQLSQSELIWNRACSGLTSELRQGDRALTGLLVAHGLTMNGGVLHAVECLAENELSEAEAGYKYFGLDPAAAILARAKAILDSGEDTEDYEDDLDESYYEVVPDDEFLLTKFKNHLRANPSEYLPANKT